MIAPALLALAIAADAPPAAGPASTPEVAAPAAARPREVPTVRPAVGAGAFGSQVYGLHVSGVSLRAGASFDANPGTALVGGADLGIALDVGSTPEGLRVTHVEALGVAWARLGLARAGLGIGLGAFDVERVTHRGGRLFGLVPSLHALLALDLPVPGRVRWSLELNGAVSVPYEGLDTMYPAFPRIAALAGARL